MNKFNRKFRSRCVRYERWLMIARKLSEFEGLINSYDFASPDEIHALKEIHRKLYECYLMAKDFEEELRPYEQILR